MGDRLRSELRLDAVGGDHELIKRLGSQEAPANIVTPTGNRGRIYAGAVRLFEDRHEDRLLRLRISTDEFSEAPAAGPAPGGPGRLRGPMKTPQQLIEDALAEPPDSHERAKHVSLLHARGGEEGFRAAAGLLDSADPDQRSLGADILGQLGAARDVPVQQRPFASPGAEAIIARIDEEKDPRVPGLADRP